MVNLGLEVPLLPHIVQVITICEIGIAYLTVTGILPRLENLTLAMFKCVTRFCL